MVQTRLFVSYSSTDRDWVVGHLSMFRRAGFQPWYDDEIRAGDGWRDAISDAIETADVLMFVVSARSTESARCREEVDFALDLDLPILTVYIEEAALPGRLRFRLSGRQAIHAWRLDDDAVRDKLSAAACGIVDDRARRLPHLPAPARRKLRLVVLPFDNGGDDPESAWFCDGISEEVIGHLGKVYRDRVDVIARSSAMAYRGRTVKEVGLDLEADAVVEGSVQMDRNRFRLRASLVRVDGQVQIWSDVFEGRTGDGADDGIFAVQEAIARGVAESLELPIADESRRPFGSATGRARDAYLKGRFHWYRHSPEDFAIAESYFNDAIAADPGYAPAYIGLADAIGTPAHRGEAPASDLFPQARDLIDKALALDPALAEAHDLRARIAFSFDYEWEQARAGFERAVALNPSYPDAYVIEAQLLGITGERHAALDYVRRGLDLDPYNIFFQSQLGLHLTGVDRFEDALDIYRSLPDGFPVKNELLWGACYRVGEYAEAMANARRFFGADAELLERLGPAGAADGDAAGYRERMARVAGLLAARSNAGYVSAALIARVFTHADQLNEAAGWLNRAVDIRDSYAVYAALMPEYSRLWPTAGFRAFAARIGLADGDSTR